MISNSALAGIINEALNHECIEEIYGALNGMRGLLQEQIIDLADESQQAIRALRTSPGTALGSSDYRLKVSTDMDRLKLVLDTHNIKFLFICGGQEDMEMASRVTVALAESKSDVRVIGVPQAIDNSLPLTDHTPGYGSTAKYLSTVVRELACDARSTAHHDQVIILEVPGATSGWVVASSVLAKRRSEPNDAPHLVYLPEVAFDTDRFIDGVAETLKSQPFCLIVVGEALSDEIGNYISFGDKESAGDYLKMLADRHITGVKAKCIRLGQIVRSAAHWRSETDEDEAFLTGVSAVEAACEGKTGKMITLVRGDADQYEVETGLADLAEVAGGSKHINPNWIGENKSSMNYHFSKYAKALIEGEVAVPTEHGLPHYVELAKRRIDPLLAPYTAE